MSARCALVPPTSLLSYMPACLADQSYPFDPRATSFKPPGYP